MGEQQLSAASELKVRRAHCRRDSGRGVLRGVHARRGRARGGAHPLPPRRQRRPLVLLHGHPRTHATWHKVAALLAAAPHRRLSRPARLRASRRCRRPATTTRSRRSARWRGTSSTLMRHLGHERFGVVGHDRGSAVAYRLALDHPDAVTRLAVLDCIPIGEHLARADARFALAWWHWFFFGQTEKPAERVINADPEAWYANTPEHMGQEAYDDLWARSAIRTSCTAWSRTTARGSPSTVPPTTPTRRPGGRSTAPCSSAGRPATTSRSSTATRSHLARLGDRRARRRDRLRPPHGRGGAGRARRGAARVLLAVDRDGVADPDDAGVRRHQPDAEPRLVIPLAVARE